MGRQPAAARAIELSEPVLQTLADISRQHGAAAITGFATNWRPICDHCVPTARQLHIERTSPLAELTDEELQLIEETLRAGRARLVPEIDGEAVAVPKPEKP